MRISLATLTVTVVLLISYESSASAASPSAIRVKEQKILEAILATGYDKRIRPPGKGETDGQSKFSMLILAKIVTNI